MENNYSIKKRRVGFKSLHIESDSTLKIGIIDADLLDGGTRHPNLCLEKISSYCKLKGHDVRLICDYSEIKGGIYDYLAMSKVFSFSRVPAFVEKMIDDGVVVIGGTGFYETGCPNLEYEVEHIMPDYHLYDEYIERRCKTEKDRKRLFNDYINYSVGFMTRGCFRKCSFCVNRVFDKVEKHSELTEFLDESREGIFLWDDNVMGYSHFEEVINALKETGKPFQFRQGLDIRLMTDRKAELLNTCRYKGDFIFAFDHLSDAELIERKLQLWRKHSNKPTKLYVLSGFESQDEKDIEGVFERIRILMKYNCLPYIMKYEDYKKSEYRGMYINIGRWCNQPGFFRNYSFREFCVANDTYYHNHGQNHKLEHPKAYTVMVEFEKKFPEIAKKYYDIKLSDFKEQYGKIDI